MGLYDMNYHLAIDWWMESHQSRRIAATLLFQHTKLGKNNKYEFWNVELPFED